jgi:hypothetical protein
MISSSCDFVFVFAMLTIDEPTTKKLCNESFINLVVKVLVDKLPILSEFINLMAFGSFHATIYISYDNKCC